MKTMASPDGDFLSQIRRSSALSILAPTQHCVLAIVSSLAWVITGTVGVLTNEPRRHPETNSKDKICRDVLSRPLSFEQSSNLTSTPPRCHPCTAPVSSINSKSRTQAHSYVSGRRLRSASNACWPRSWQRVRDRGGFQAALNAKKKRTPFETSFSNSFTCGVGGCIEGGGHHPSKTSSPKPSLK